MAKSPSTLPLHTLLVALALLVMGLAVASYVENRRPVYLAFATAPATAGGEQPVYARSIVSQGDRRLVHAASGVFVGDVLRAFWFAGTREGASDVEIRTAVFQGEHWSPSTTSVTRQWLETHLNRQIRKLGNAVPVYWGDGQLSLAVVSVSAGGWAGSSINWLDSVDGGATWEQARRLVTSPAANLSTLVKAPPVPLQNGQILLPVYHEFAGKFSEILRIDEDGRIHAKQRLDYRRRSLQPVIAVQDEKHATVLSRYAWSERPRHSQMNSTNDGGISWSSAQASGLPNPNSALALLPFDGGFIAVGNLNEEERDELSLAWSPDGHQWTVLWAFEDRAATRGQAQAQQAFIKQLQSDLEFVRDPALVDRLIGHAVRNKCGAGGCEWQYDYPFLLRAPDGSFHLLYTWNKSAVMHVQFNAAWLNGLRNQKAVTLTGGPNDV